MHGSTLLHFLRFSKKTILFGLLSTTLIASGCARSDRAILDQSESLINQRKYQQAVDLLEKQLPEHNTPEIKTQLGYAYLGLSGIEMISLAQHVSFLKSFQHVDLNTKSFDQTCPELPIEAARSLSATCLPLIKIEGFPSPENPNLLKALAIFEQVYPDASSTNQNINLLLAVVYIGLATANYDLLLTQQLNLEKPSDLELERELQIQLSTQSLKYFKHSLSSLFTGLHRLFYSYGKIKRFLDKYNGKPILTIGGYTYYGSQNISAEDFFQFLITSGKSEVQTVISEESSKQKTIEDFSRALSRSLSFLRLKITDGKEDFLGNYYGRFLGLGASMVPQRFVYDPSVKTNLSIDVNDVHLPKIISRLIHSVSTSWTQENTRFIFDVSDNLKQQLTVLQDLSQNWNQFWLGLDSSTQEQLKTDLNNRVSVIPEVEINPDHLPDLNALKPWYTAAFEQLKNLPNDIERDSGYSTPSYNTSPKLIQETQDWVNENLW